jgi:hypothetical protein
VLATERLAGAQLSADADSFGRVLLTTLDLALSWAGGTVFEWEICMLKSRLAAGTIVSLLSAFGLGLLGSTAHALTPIGSRIEVGQPTGIQKVARVVRVGRRGWVYRRAYGPRYRFRRAGFGYYYGGWWYPRPWWTVGPGYGPYWGPGLGINLCIGC